MQTTVDRLYQEMLQAIVECELSPGASFSEAELGRRYSASRTPIREACRRLENDGLIRIAPFRGYSIVPLSVKEFLELEELQLIIEPAAAALAAVRISEEQLAALEGCAFYEYQKGDPKSYREFIQSNYKFHTVIAQASRNKQLCKMVENVQIRLMRFFYLGLPFDSWGEQLVTEHRSLVEAIRNHRPEEARRFATVHLQNAMQRSNVGTMNAIRFGEMIFDPSSSEPVVWMSNKMMSNAAFPRSRTPHKKQHSSSKL
ncbi:GntR family transcriptional regulator [Granulicella arctica]|uniref:DNA-binding GntR family transcriptional regulator n=1 Tax=Granulicella arctica TaxID=940613 RepID=A0A7Y9TTR5_9BACT|nr:GntR family transcriptional regulator [Granulicella arctica]NYF80233.1 DNA-binding GntR family transcriptional regulator [Granulicella arctica]